MDRSVTRSQHRKMRDGFQEAKDLIAWIDDLLSVTIVSDRAFRAMKIATAIACSSAPNDVRVSKQVNTNWAFGDQIAALALMFC